MHLVCSIGFFDGVHRGHQHLIRQVRDEAQRRGARSLLITFDRHPRTVFAPNSVPPLLTTAEEKMALLKATGVDDIFVLPFDRTMAALTAREFMKQVLKGQLGVDALVIGYDHHFGRPTHASKEKPSMATYQAWGREVGIDVVQATELEGIHVSSSAIRQALDTGDVASAAQLLGRPYSWTGHVVHGRGIGRQLGFPTANLEATDKQKLLPKNGAYAVRVHVTSPMGECWEGAGMLNIGRRPTLDNGLDTSIEVHLFDFNGDLYNSVLSLFFIARLREECRFDSEVELARQLEADKANALEALNSK